MTAMVAPTVIDCEVSRRSGVAFDDHIGGSRLTLTAEKLRLVLQMRALHPGANSTAAFRSGFRASRSSRSAISATG